MISGIGQNPGTTLTFSPTLLTFPTTTIGNTSAQIYTSVSNAGNTPITLTSISITGTNAADFRITNSSGCAISPNVLAAGASCNLYVNFSPSVNGAESASLVFNDSAPGSPQIVPLSGTGQAAAPSLSFNPSVIAFSTVNLGSTTNTYTLIQNTGSAPVTLTSFTITGTNAADFSLNSSTSCAPLPFVVTAGSSCYLYVNFMPSATGSRTGSVQVAYTGSGGSPQTVGLIGSGQSATPFTVSPSTLTFAAQNLTTTSAAQAVNVYNSGGTAVTISSVQVTGANAADFTAVNGCGSSVPAGGHCVVTVTFSPAATGARTATLTLTDSAATSPQNVSLSGTGQANNQTIYISSTALTFAAQNLNTTSGAQSVYVFNNGTGSVTIGGASIAGTNASDFTISNSTCTTLAAGAGCYIFVTFSPTAVGSRVATLQISDTATGSPQSVNLNGTGRSATQTISFSPTILQYATQIVGTSSANQVLAIYNYGNSSMTVNSVTVVGANASEFTIVQNNCTLAVAVPNSYCLVYIAFTPAGIGNRVASIQVSDTAPGSPHSVPLAGTGQNSTSNLNVSSSGLSFGQQVEYTTSSAQYFYLYNVGTSPITISGLSMTGTNAGDFSISQNECPLSPAAIGTNCYIYIQFTPTTTGDEMATLQITDSATGSPHSVQLTGIGIAQTQITSLQPSELNLGSVQLGSSTGATSNYFYIYNKGTTPLTFTSISVVGTNSGDFSFGTTTCPSAPSTLAAGGSCYVYVSFTPQAAGPRTASIQILDSAPDSGVSVSLEGIGLTPATYLSLNPNNLTFAPQFPNTTSASQYFYIYNRGTTPLSLTSETITGTNSGDFSMGTTNCAATIAVNGNCYIYVTFDPLAVGPRTALLQVVDNATGSPQSVSLNGIGQSMIPSIRFDPVNLVFPTETVGTTSGAMYIQINNNGDVAYTLSGISLTGGNSSDFAITSDGCPLSPSMFNPGGLCYVYMTFTPSASGLRTTSLQVSDTLTGSPQLITITGLGSGSSQILQPSVSSIVFPTETIGTQSGASAVTVYNEGNTAITGLAANITGTNAGDFAISSNNCPTPLNPAAGCTIDVTFDPAAVDLRTATLNITGTASNSPQTVTLTGIGQTVTENALDLNQTEMTFGPQNLGTVSGAQGVTIYNYGTGSIAFSGFSITGTNSGDFGISSNNCPANLSAGGGCTVDITFDPSIVGPETATLQIVSNAAGSPQTVSLFGTGQAITEQVYVSQTALAFASQNVNTTSGALSVTVYNEGTGSLTFTGFTIMGTNPGDFTISSNNCPFTLGSTGGCSIFVTFTPAAGGNRSATLQIASNAPGSPQNIELDGDGLLPITTDVLTNTTLAFGAQTDGVTTSGHIDYIYNYGTAPLTINSLAITGPNSADFAITSSTCSSVILAGGSCYFYVAFTPSIVGQESASLIVTDSAADSPTTVNLTGTGQAQTQILAPGSTELTFTALNIGATSAQQGVSVTNYGNTTLTFTGFSITGANAGDFAISQNTCSITLGAGASCTIYVKFTPSVVDVESAALQIADTAVGSPQSVSLFGTGVTPVSQITFSQSSINFGTHNVGTTSAQSSVSVYNYGNTTLSLTGFAVAGTNASEFAIASNTCPSTLTVSSSCTVYLTFTPSATGQQVAYLQVTDTAGGSPQAINLYGTGQ
jgi:hypothetical protein